MKTLAFLLYITFFSVWFAAAAVKIDPQQFHFEKEVNELVSDAGKVCDKDKSLMQGVTLSLSPKSPKKREDETITVNYGNLTKDVEGGKIVTKVKYSIITVIDRTDDLCEQVHCPLKSGKGSLSTKEKIPGDAPSGHYTGNVKITDKEGKEVLCVDLDFEL